MALPLVRNVKPLASTPFMQCSSRAKVTAASRDLDGDPWSIHQPAHFTKPGLASAWGIHIRRGG